MNMTITEFCRKHEACAEGREWALENCKTMNEVWEKAKPEWLIWVATCPGVLTKKELRLFAVWSARRVQHLMTDKRSITALDVAERYAHGNATVTELEAAREAAWAAARAAGAAAWAAIAAARAAARAAGAAAWAAIKAEAREAQAEYLRTNCKPNFKL